MMRWFGVSWGAPVNKDCPEVPVPVGTACSHCEEPIAEGEPGIEYANGPVTHLNCFLRQIYGSVAHIEGRCSCALPGSVEGDPEGMTPRQAADAAVEAYRLKYNQRQKHDDGLRPNQAPWRKNRRGWMGARSQFDTED
jgi:hypothetical protein